MVRGLLLGVLGLLGLLGCSLLVLVCVIRKTTRLVFYASVLLLASTDRRFGRKVSKSQKRSLDRGVGDPGTIKFPFKADTLHPRP